MSYMPRAERRQAILEATLKLATENGFAGLTARAIARELDAATGIVHHHFESLEDLKCAAFRYANENGFHKHLEKARSMPPRDGIQFILASYPEHGEEFEIRIWMSAGDESLRSEQMQQAFTECYNSTQQVLTDIIEAGRTQGAFSPRLPSEKAAWKLLGLSFTLMDVSYLKGTNLDRQTALEIISSEIDETLGVERTE
ncbi:TetR family transcriptional regulator [Pseudovibrio exalbescens]|uniref:HTH tetR-type domain-containing protein n=1 Tax=Pseudovibrio exalbescens TaxID=197461 RepID=A0A1U7JFR2_9HYPH|nr:TetR family transcriptional regulator [Pseudovibrio exalbescens]OKL43481.1 hypothetical protein A3843_12610 [Pseudovibrio exalbescens]